MYIIVEDIYKDEESIYVLSLRYTILPAIDTLEWRQRVCVSTYLIFGLLQLQRLFLLPLILN